MTEEQRARRREYNRKWKAKQPRAITETRCCGSQVCRRQFETARLNQRFCCPQCRADDDQQRIDSLRAAKEREAAVRTTAPPRVTSLLHRNLISRIC